MKLYNKPLCLSYFRNEASNLLFMESCDCGHTGNQSVCHCVSAQARVDPPPPSTSEDDPDDNDD